MYTDGSDFVSIGCNTTDTGDHPSDSEGSSAGSEEGVERSFDTREGEYESDNHAAENPKKAKGALAMLGSLAGRAKKGMEGAKDDGKGEPASPAAKSPKGGGEGRRLQGE